MFLRNLNLFLPYFYILSKFLAGLLAATIILISPKNVNIASYLSYLLIAIVLITVWWRTGLSPSSYIPEREKRFKRGHILVAIGNIIGIGAVVFMILVAYKLATFGNLPFLFIPVGLFVVIAWIVGIIMIWTSRQMPNQSLKNEAPQSGAP